MQPHEVGELRALCASALSSESGSALNIAAPPIIPSITSFFIRSSILIIALHATCGLWAMPGHAGPIQMDLGVTPVVQRISCGQEAALVNGRRACRADLSVS